MEMKMQMQQESNEKRRIMPLPYEAEIGDRLSDDGDCYVINCEQGSVAEMQCPADVEEATARFMVLAANNHGAMRAALEALEPYLTTEAQLLDNASLNEGRAGMFDVASLKARHALAQVRAAQEQS